MNASGWVLNSEKQLNVANVANENTNAAHSHSD